MIPDFFEDQAVLYVSGHLPEERKDTFELLLQCHEELRHFTASLAETSMSLTDTKVEEFPSPELKDRVLCALASYPQSVTEALVMSDPEARVQWVNSSFTKMCGHPLEAIKGKKLGPILQGKKTDVETSGRMRKAIQTFQRCREIILNYHRDGHPYWVEVVLTPIKDDADRTLCFVAQEYERPDIALP
jgi:PAS domain S-box-containing protein